MPVGSFFVWKGWRKSLSNPQLKCEILSSSSGSKYFVSKSFISRDISRHDHVVHTHTIDLKWRYFCKGSHLKIYKKGKHSLTAFEFSPVFNLKMLEGELI